MAAKTAETFGMTMRMVGDGVYTGQAVHALQSFANCVMADVVEFKPIKVDLVRNLSHEDIFHLQVQSPSIEILQAEIQKALKGEGPIGEKVFEATDRHQALGLLVDFSALMRTERMSVAGLIEVPGELAFELEGFKIK